MSIATITTGDDSNLPVQLKKDNATFVIDAGAVIKAVITTTDSSSTLSETITIDNLATGTDLSNSLIIVNFTPAQTGAITTYGTALLEIQVDDNIKTTWKVMVTIVKGNIT